MPLLPKIIALVFLLSVSTYPQNLIPDPGFENDLTGWNAFWSRDANAGSFTIATSPVHGGTKSGHVRHSGTQDWSESPAITLQVRPGQLYQYSAWVRVDSLAAGSSAEISVVLLDTGKNAISWSYAAKPCTLSAGVFVQYTTRFLIPSSIAFVQPRIIGSGPCDLYADDFSLTLADSVPSRYSHPYVLENAVFRVSIDPVAFGIVLQSKTTAKAYSTEGVGVFETAKVDSFPDSIVFHCEYLPDSFPVTIATWLEGPALGIRLVADSSRAMTSALSFPGPISSASTDFLIIPKGTGVICPAAGAPAYMNRYYWISMYDWQTDLCFVGVTNKTSGYMITTDDPWFTRASFSGTSGSTALAPHIVLEPAKNLFAKSRALYYTVIDTGGYVAMCSWYRTHAQQRGYVRTFAQKAAAAPQIDRLRGAVDFWILGNGFWFDKAAFFRTLIDDGLDRAVFSGNFSNAVIDTLNSLGFLTSIYDCYCDAYPPGHQGYKSDGYNTGAIVNEDGSIMNGWLAYLDGGQTLQAQEVCAAAHCGYAIPRITSERTSKHFNCRFIDVELATGLKECYAASHPVNRCTDALARTKLFDTLRSSFGLVLGGEQARDFAFPFVDYGEGTMSPCPAVNAGYDWMTPAAPDSDFVHYDVNPAIRVPLHGLTYHDVHVPTWYTGDGLSRVPAFWDEKDLFNILYASMPLFMPPDTAYWSANFERFLTSYNLVSAVTRRAGFAKMTGHSFVTADGLVQQTTFDNGWNVAVNFDSVNSFTWNGHALAPRGFYASCGAEEVYRLSTGTGAIACSRLSDRLFVNGYGAATEVAGVRSTGAVFLRRDSSFVSLAFVGSQASVDLHPARIPWPVTGLRVFTKDRSQEVAPVLQPDGFFRITRLPGISVYRIEGSFAAVSLKPAATPSSRLSVRSGPHHSIVVSMEGIDSHGVKAEISDCAGRLVQTVDFPPVPAGAAKIFASRPLPCGVYVVRYGGGTFAVTNRVVVIY